MTSRFVDPYQPPKPIPLVEYELSHHQYCSQDRVLVTSIGTFPTLHDAQDSAQDLLQTTLNQYMSRGWIGFYCKDIDLEHRGIIAGYLSEQEHVYLSEIQIHAREKADQTVQPHADGIEAWALSTGHQPVSTRHGYSTAHRTYVALDPTELPTPWRPANIYMPPQQEQSSYPWQEASTYMQSQQEHSPHGGHTRGMESFSRTRPQYPDRTDFFVPRPTAQYDETMGFSSPQNHGPNAYQGFNNDATQQQSRPQRHGNALGGGIDIGSPYLGRRHSSIELKSGSKQFQYTVDKY